MEFRAEVIATIEVIRAAIRVLDVKVSFLLISYL